MITMYSRYFCISRRIHDSQILLVSTVSSYLLLCDSDQKRLLLILGCSHFLWKNLRLHSYVYIYLSFDLYQAKSRSHDCMCVCAGSNLPGAPAFSLSLSLYAGFDFIAESAVLVLQPKLSSLLKLFTQLHDFKLH